MNTDVGTTSIVRENLMNREGYAPYCGNPECRLNWPRTHFLGGLGQFKCGCGWKSEFPANFIADYRAKWKL